MSLKQWKQNHASSPPLYILRKSLHVSNYIIHNQNKNRLKFQVNVWSHKKREQNYDVILCVAFHLYLNSLFSLLIYYLLTYLLTPWCRVLLEKLTGLQLVKKFPVFHGTRRFITTRTSVRQLSLSWANPIQSIYPHSTSWRSILILSTHLRLGLLSGLLLSGFPSKTLYTLIFSPIRATCSAHLILLIYYVLKIRNNFLGV